MDIVLLIKAAVMGIVEGLTEFLREQISAYCDKAIELIDKRLEESKTQNPPA